jgi:hypothetical protein
MVKNPIIIKVYARDNLGSTYPDEGLIEVAKKIKNIWEKQGYEKAVEMIEEIIEEVNDEYDTHYEYEINDEEIIIYNEKKDSYGSWGYEEAVIFEFPLLEMIEKAKKWVDDEAGYVLIEKGVEETELEWICDEHIIYEDCIITTNELKEIIDEFGRIIGRILKDFYIIGKPITSQNPFAYGYDEWKLETESDTITFYTKGPVQCGAGYLMDEGYLVFKKDKEAKKTLEELRELIKKYAPLIQELFQELLKGRLRLYDYEEVFEEVCYELPPEFDQFTYNLKLREIFLFLKNLKAEILE